MEKANQQNLKTIMAVILLIIGILIVIFNVFGKASSYTLTAIFLLDFYLLKDNKIKK